MGGRKMKLPIDKNIPLPDPGRPRKIHNYPFEECEPGDSFLVPEKEIEAIRQRFIRFGNNQTPPWDIRSARWDDKNFRLWRIK